MLCRIACVAVGLLQAARAMQMRITAASDDVEGVKPHHEARTTQKPRALAFKHLSKMAGTELIETFNNIMGKGNWTLIDELFALTPQRRGDAFVIASVRNPCDYYVSLWAFDSSKNFAKFSKMDGGSAFFEEGNENKEKFANWVTWTQSHGHGILSYRLWETLLGLKDDLTCWDQVLGFCGKDFDDNKVEQDLAAWAPSKTADCWVHTENLVDDLKHCFTKYEDDTGAKIDWARFEEHTAKWRKVDGSKNRSDHQKCDYYYSDELAQSVMKSDKHIFDAFGYETCCGPATGEQK
jgi:hypothetical protein